MIAAIFSNFLRSELYSPLASSIGKWTLITDADLWLLLFIRWVTAYWETSAAWLLKSKSCKLTLKYLKICSGNPKFFRSITWNPVYLSSILWHYPFKKLIWLGNFNGLLFIWRVFNGACGHLRYLLLIIVWGAYYLLLTNVPRFRNCAWDPILLPPAD